MAENGSTNQSAKILATNAKFVPTALAASAGEDFRPDSVACDPVDWQTAMKLAVRNSSQLLEMLGIPLDRGESGDLGDLAVFSGIQGEKTFPTFVPLEFLRRMKPGDPDDPLLRQVLPIAAEDSQQQGESSDPVGDLDSLSAPGLLHKYHGRALLVVSGACGVHCRYCFRREFPYQQESGPVDRWNQAIEYLRRNPEIEEVLLSGGDPLTLTDPALSHLIDRLETVGHVRRLRIHTRMPIVIPQRVTDQLVDRLADSRLTAWFVVHANHPHELDEHVLNALARLIDRGIPVLNQAVLLKGVNDDANILADLCRRLVNHRIQPYYLHQLDRVRGATHFEVSVEQGRQLIEELREVLPGYAVPQYVVEQSGEPSKTPI
ncbi:MAG: EF-P beta-lysylation protein EpmB [Rubripirellula sp.]|nr:EF-P beta-lysylation protein EpmB [Rubripirellula sp.]